jgi:hypothetical protein
MYNPTTIAAHTPDTAQCERLTWLYLGGNIACWYAEYSAFRGKEHADAALKAEIERTAMLAARCRLYERWSLAADMWAGIAASYEAHLAAMLKVRGANPPAEREA